MQALALPEKLFEQRSETCLLEMFVAGESLGVILRVAGNFGGLRVAFLAGIQQREKKNVSAKTVVISWVRHGDSGRG